MKRRLGETLGWIGLLGALAGLGWVLIATAFMVYDDEGYVLMSVRQFCDGKPLYTEVFSQYGPAFFLFYRGLHALTGLVYDHEIGRLLTLGYWLTTAGIIGWLTRSLTASVVTGWAAAALGFVALIPNINEPFHPGSLLVLLSVLAAWAGVEYILRGWSQRMGLTLGLLGAFILLMKVNAGLFLLSAWGGWWLAQEVNFDRWRHYLAWGVSVGVIAAPLVLMRLHLAEPWALSFAWIFSAGALGLWWQVGRPQGHHEKPAGWGWLGVVGVVIGAVITSMAALGTPPAALVEGSLLAPLRHPHVYTFPVRTTLLIGGLAWGSLAAFGWVRRRPLSGHRTALVVAVRVAGLVGYFWQARDPNRLSNLSDYALAWGPALTCWMLIPLTEPSTRQLRARWWLGWAFVWQLLQAYPVAGSQVAWGSVLWVAIAGVGCVDLWRYGGLRWRWAPVVGVLAWSGMAFASTNAAVMCARAWWMDSAPLQLPGARWLRPPPDITRSLQVLQTNIQRDAGVVFSLPGMFSLNLWSGRPTPTAANATHWFSLLNEQQQAEIVRVLAADSRAMVVVQRDLLGFLFREGFGPSGPLSDYVRTAFVPALRVGSYDLCVKRGRQLTAYDTFRVEKGRLVAWVVRKTGAEPIWLHDPARPNWPGVCLVDAVWSHSDGTTWRIDAPLPAGWPAAAHRELVIRGTMPQLIPENSLPAVERGGVLPE